MPGAPPCWHPYCLLLVKVETHFARAVRCLAFADAQMQILVGALLGDGTLQKTTSGYAFRAHHAIAQAPLVLWKYEILKPFVRTAPRVSGRAVYFKTVTHPVLSELRAAFYPLGAKRIPVPVLEQWLTPAALAVWIMDDGAADGNAIRLNTQSFSVEDVAAAAELIRTRFQVRPAINFDKGMPRLRFSVSDTVRIAKLVAPYIIPEMRYKLPPIT